MGERLRGVSTRTTVVAASAALVIVALMLATTHGAPVVHPAASDRPLPRATLQPLPTTSQPPVPSVTPTAATGPPMPWLGLALTGVVAAVAAFLLLLLTAAVVRVLRSRRRAPAPIPEAPPPPSLPEQLHRDAATHLAALREGEPREAIVRSWVTLQQSVAAAGVARRPSETSSELTLRVLDDLAVDPDALRTLAELYREARFSRHPLADADRARAEAALRRVHATLPVAAPEPS